MLLKSPRKGALFFIEKVGSSFGNLEVKFQKSGIWLGIQFGGIKGFPPEPPFPKGLKRRAAIFDR